MQEFHISNSISLTNSQILFPRQTQLTRMQQSKKTSHNPIFNKLNKIFLQPKLQSKTQQFNSFSFVPLVSSIKINHPLSNQSQQISFGLKQNVNKEQLVTAETQPSCVFFKTNSSSIFGKNNTQTFQFTTTQNKENDPFLTDNIPKQSDIFRNGKVEEQNQKVVKCEKNENSKSMISLARHQRSQKYFYQNHKLNKLEKPHIGLPQQKITEQHIQKRRDSAFCSQISSYLSSVNNNQTPQNQQQTSKYVPQSAALIKIQQLQQKVLYHERMQQFYLSQIQTYRQQKQTLEWKLKLIVDELLFLTMKEKFVGSGIKGSESMINQSKELLMSKFNELNFSQQVNNIIVENKENYSIGSNIKLMMSSQNNCIQRIDKPHIDVSNHANRQPRQAFDLQTSSHYISSFLLDNVTLVESQDQDNDKNLENDEERRRRILFKERIVESDSDDDLAQPKCLAFT